LEILSTEVFDEKGFADVTFLHLRS
jgi:hypothetical protein